MANQTINVSIGRFISLIASPKEWLIMQDESPYLAIGDRLTIVEINASSVPTGRQAYGYVDIYNSGMFFTNESGQNMYHLNYVNTAPWIDYSSQTTVVGVSPVTVKKVYYCVLDTLVFVQFQIRGVSATNQFTFTLPIASSTNSRRPWNAILEDEGAGAGTNPAGINNTPGSNVASMMRSFNTGVWPIGGDRECRGCFFYRINPILP